MAPKRVSFSLNPHWGHYAAGVALVLSLVVGALRYAVLGMDSLHCRMNVFDPALQTGWIHYTVTRFRAGDDG